MTKAQAAMLRLLIEADRDYRSRAQYPECTADPDWRGVEVGGIFGGSIRTAQSLVDAGLAEMVAFGPNNQNARIFLGKASPVDFIETEERY